MQEMKRNLHLKLQEYCSCYMDTDPKAELEAISKEGAEGDATGDPQEVALKFLALAILYGINEKADKIKLTRKEKEKDKVEVSFKVKGEEKYKLSPPSSHLSDQIFEVMRAITHLEEDKASEPLSLGIGNDSIELGIELKRKEDKESLKIIFPEG